MQKFLIYLERAKILRDEEGDMPFPTTKPVLSFEYDELKHYDVEQVYRVGEEWLPLSDAQKQEIIEYIHARRLETDAMVEAVDFRGVFLGSVHANDPRVFKIVDTGAINSNWVYDFDRNEFVMGYFFNEQGKMVRPEDPNNGFTKIAPTQDREYHGLITWNSTKQKWEIVGENYDKMLYMIKSKANVAPILRAISTSLITTSEQDTATIMESLTTTVLDSVAVWSEAQLASKTITPEAKALIDVAIANFKETHEMLKTASSSEDLEVIDDIFKIINASLFHA